jgi:Family of unknown function (DUF6151)
MEHPLQCRCGTIKGVVKNPQSANRAVCYCKDCQAFARFLGWEGEILDEKGGTDVIQVLPGNITFASGIEALACIRLTENGMLRWYASCCNTPVGNTLANYKISFIGLVHNCLEMAGKPLDNSFGPIRARVNTKGAKGDPKPQAMGAGRIILWFIASILKARIDGSYRQTPFFLIAKGTAIVSPRVLTGAERAALAAR